MSETTQIVVDTTIAAPLETVWKALRDPALIQTWFGWDAPALAEEIRFIFVDAATELASHRLQFGEWEGVADAIVLAKAGDGTRLQVVRDGGNALDWAGRYDDVAEGWVTFFSQLKLALEQHAGAQRRTIYLSGAAQPGVATPSVALGLGPASEQSVGESYQVDLATGETIKGLVWHKTHFQTGLTVEQWGHGLLVVSDMGVSPKRPNGGGSVVLTTYGLGDADFVALEQRWTAWWNAGYSAPAA